MQTDPIMEWQRLTEHYRGLHDEELCELALDIGDLTDTAQQALRQELRSRRLGEPETAMRTLEERNSPETASVLERAELGVRQSAEEEAVGQNVGPSVEYTWKTPLCGCESQEQAWQISEVLRRAGIESWIERAGARHFVPYSDDGMVGNLQVLVAADQLDEARTFAAQPIPQDIIAQSTADVPEYEPPVCPKCGAADPILEAAEPTNEWLCEACGAEWSDPVGEQ